MVKKACRTHVLPPRGKRVNDYHRWRIVDLFAAGKTPAAISRELRITRRTVYRWVKPCHAVSSKSWSAKAFPRNIDDFGAAGTFLEFFFPYSL
jgi:hypothetical protein